MSGDRKYIEYKSFQQHRNEIFIFQIETRFNPALQGHFWQEKVMYMAISENKILGINSMQHLSAILRFGLRSGAKLLYNLKPCNPSLHHIGSNHNHHHNRNVNNRTLNKMTIQIFSKSTEKIKHFWYATVRMI